jgi:hypothetical protein
MALTQACPRFIWNFFCEQGSRSPRWVPRYGTHPLGILDAAVCRGQSETVTSVSSPTLVHVGGLAFPQSLEVEP